MVGCSGAISSFLFNVFEWWFSSFGESCSHYFFKFRMKRIKANDPVAICYEGISQFGKGDYSSAFKYYSKAAELGDAEAHYKLSMMNDDGVGVEQDSGKTIHHLEEAALVVTRELEINLDTSRGIIATILRER